MLHNISIKPQSQRSQSPCALLDLNLKQKFKPLSEILKSPMTQRRMAKNAAPIRSPSTNHPKYSSTSKENPQQSKAPMQFSFRTSTSLKDVLTFKPKRTKTASIKLYKESFVNSLIKSTPLDTTQGFLQEDLKVSDFIKIRELGRGKFGVVWMVRHKTTNFVCALKIINKKVVKQQKVELQVAKEIRIHHRLKHLNIIAFYGFFTDKQNVYIITEFASQGHVFDKLKKHHRLEEAEVRDITRQTADGLRIIHSMGYVHRDIKPQNLLLQFGVVKICDFGWIAQCRGDQMRRSQCGTPLYYSPQIVKKEPHNAQIDVWSLGLLAYELIVGRVPFRIWSQFDLPLILKQEVTIPDYVDSSEHLKDFVTRCLTKNQKQRPLLHDLREHKFINQGMFRVQSASGLYGDVKNLF